VTFNFCCDGCILTEDVTSTMLIIYEILYEILSQLTHANV